MNKKNLGLFWIISLMIISLTTDNAYAQDTQDLPNIIFIMADDMGYGDIQAYNSESKIPTPNLDKLAGSGMMFTDAHSPGSSCVRSRYSLLTGRFPFRAETLEWREEPLIEESRMTIASMLKKNGYHTGMVGKWHLGFDYSDYDNLTGGPVDRGFDYYFGISRSLDQADYYYIEDRKAVQSPTEYVNGIPGTGPKGVQGPFWRAGYAGPDFKHDEVLGTFTQKSVDFIEESADSSAPFFLYMALASPHTPWFPSEQFHGRSGAGEYGDWVAENDSMVGTVIQKIYDKGIENNTLIFFTSDNGPVWYTGDIQTYGHRATSIYRGMKHDAWEGGHRMPFIASWPGVIEPGSRRDQVIALTDMMATFTDLVGDTLPDNAGEDSYSILNALVEKDFDKEIREAYVGTPDNADLFIRQSKWKLMGPTQLYNLDEDPSEQTNVYNSNIEIAEKLNSLLNKYKDEGRSTPWVVKEHNLGALNRNTLNNLPAYASNIFPELEIENVGLCIESNVPVLCEIDSAGTVIYSDTKSMEEVLPFETGKVTFKKWQTGAGNTYTITFVIQLTNDEDKSNDTIQYTINVSNLLDDFENGSANWTTDANWGTDSRRSYSGESSLVINPGGNYENKANSYALYKYPLDLTHINDPYLSFWSQNTMSGSDHGFVEFCIDSGETWEKVSDNFSGNNSVWEQQVFSLQNYKESNNFQFRFRFISDMMITGAGWFIDDLRIDDGKPAGIKDEVYKIPTKYHLEQNYPNPFNPETNINFELPKSCDISLVVYNMLGEKVKTLVDQSMTPGNHNIIWNGTNDLNTAIANGVYFVKLKSYLGIKTKKMILLK